MRVSSTMMTGNYMKQLQRSYKKQADLMEQGDGQRIHRPSDDPVAFVRSMTFKNSLSENEQYTQNLGDAVSWMKTSDGAMVDMTEIMKTLTERITDSANGTNTQADREKIAQEVEGLLEQLVTLGNTQLGDRYVFAGQSDKVQPFSIGEVTDKADVKTLDDKQVELFGVKQMLELKDAGGDTYYWDSENDRVYTQDYVDEGYKNILSANADKTEAEKKAAVQAENIGGLGTTVGAVFNKSGQIAGGVTNSFTTTPPAGGTAVTLSFTTSDKTVVIYSGDDKKISMPIQNGDATPDRDSVNATGGDVFGTDIFGGYGASILNDMYEVCRKMRADDGKWLSGDGVQLANYAYDQVLSGETELAARTQTYNQTLETFEKQNTIITSDITDASATNIASLSVELLTAQTLYNMSLSLGAKILPQSLTDYL